MDARDTLITAIARRACALVTKRTIRTLQQMTDLQSGDDSVLRNVWDEVCVQVQGQESALWDAYLDTATQVIAHQLSKIALEERQAIWLQTDSGLNWDMDEESGDVPSDDDDIAQYILHEYVIPSASNWTNARIERYKEQSIEFD